MKRLSHRIKTLYRIELDPVALSSRIVEFLSFHPFERYKSKNLPFASGSRCNGEGGHQTGIFNTLYRPAMHIS